MSITSKEFEELARGKMRGKLKTSKPSIRKPLATSKQKKESAPKNTSHALNLPKDVLYFNHKGFDLTII